jgi:Ca-activated chloride channel family protein
MKSLTQSFGLALCALVTLITSSAQAAGTLTFLNSHIAPVETVDHHIAVVMNNGFARTEVTQLFFNPNDTDLEAIYSFPVPKSASLSEMTIFIGEEEIHGEVIARDEAERIYEEEAAAGNDTAIAVKNQYLTYEFRVSPVRARDHTRVRFVYYQPLEIDTGIGRFHYPLEDGGTGEAANQFWMRNDEVLGSFSIDVEIKSAVPIIDVRVPGFEQSIQIDQLGAGHFRLTGTQAGMSLNRDLVIYYRFQENQPGSVELIPYRVDEDRPGTFMMVITPGVDLAPLTHGADYVFVLDTSGSMSGKFATLARGVARALGELQPGDRFRIVTFSDRAHDLTRGWKDATPENVLHYIKVVERIKVDGSTDLFAGIKAGLDELDDDRVTSLILVTDAVANQGVVDPKAFHKLMKRYDIRVFGFLLGNSGNWPLMRTICDATGGFYTGVSNADDILGQILLAKSKVTFEAMHDVSVSISGVDVFNLTNVVPKKVYRGEQLAIFGRYDEGGTARVELKAHLSGEDRIYRTEFTFPDVALDNPEIERLWAMSQIEAIEDQINSGLFDSGEGGNAIRDLGLSFQLVTDETAMLVLSDTDFERHGIERNNRERVAVEQNAQAQRIQQPIASNRIDQSQPMFNHPTPRAGGGALDPLSALLIAGGAGLVAQRKRANRSCGNE